MNPTPAGHQPSQPPTLGDWQPLPTAGAPVPTTSDKPNPLFDTLIAAAGRDYRAWAIRIVLALVMSAALGVGTWSIYTLLTKTFGTPDFIAFLGCGLFDISAIFFGLLAQQYAVTTDSGLAPRLAMFAMVTTSSWVNWKHAQLEHWGTVGGVVFASAPVIAELAFEMWHKFEHRATLRALGRVAQTLPVLGKWAWLAHPWRSRKTIDAHIKAALTEHEAVAERREEIAAERARYIVSASPRSPLTLTSDAQPQPLTNPALTTAASMSALVTSGDAHALTFGTERPALAPGTTLTHDAHALTALGAHTLTKPSAHPPAQADERPAEPQRERAQSSDAKTERARTSAQSAPSLTARKALKEQQNALTLALYTTLNDRPEWTEIRDALTSAGLESVSRPTAQRIRERVEAAHPDLPRERRRALTASN